MLRTLVVQSRLALSSRWFSVSAISRVDQQTFDGASKLVSTLSEEPDNEAKLKLYGLYKQATEGAVKKSRPGALDFIGRAKWDAWNSLGSMTKETARDQYVAFVYKLAGKAPPTAGESQSETKSAPPPAAPSASQTTQSSSNGEIITSLDDRGVFRITFNRPAKFNSLTMNMYASVAEHLEKAAQDDRVHLTVIRGAGTYFTAGNDLANFASAGASGNLTEALAKRFPIIRRFIYAFLEHPKALVAAVNGPAIGIGVTLLAHCDFVYASKSAWLHTPFLRLGLVPEAGSSYTFPRSMGTMMANRMLLLGEKVTSEQLERAGFISQVVDDATLDSFVEERVNELADMPKFSLRTSKQLTRRAHLEETRKATEAEFQVIAEGLQRPEVIGQAIKAFTDLMSKKK